MKEFNLKIINTGGTFSKKYNKLDGTLFVDCDNVIEEIIEKSHLSKSLNITISKTICKDSLDMTDEDRLKLAEIIHHFIHERYTDAIVIVHGTDTIDVTAEFLNKNFNLDIPIILTGAMFPYRINQIEASANLISAITASQILSGGVYIAIDGIIDEFDKIIKDKEKGEFIKK
jgi:L-asparaginase